MGKSTSAEFFRHEGASIIDTDQIARDIVQPGQPALEEILVSFGKEVLKPDGSLDRARLAGIVFPNPEKRKQLEHILHPLIRANWKHQINSLSGHAEFVLVVIPLLFETGGETDFQRVVCTACTPTSQHSRLSQRGWTPRDIKDRISSQMAVAQKMDRADFVIWSEGSLEVHAAQVREIASRS